MLNTYFSFKVEIQIICNVLLPFVLNGNVFVEIIVLFIEITKNIFNTVFTSFKM